MLISIFYLINCQIPGMRKTHNIPTNYSQTLNRTKVDGVQETNGESIGTKKDELER